MMNNMNTTRRALVAGLATAPVAGLPALASSAPARMAPALADALAAHKAAAAAVDAHVGEFEIPGHLVSEELAAIRKLAETPVSSADFEAKIRYMVANQKRLYGYQWHSSDADMVMIALELHLFGEVTA